MVHMVHYSSLLVSQTSTSCSLTHILGTHQGCRLWSGFNMQTSSTLIFFKDYKSLHHFPTELIIKCVVHCRARWDALNSSSTARLSSLEESLLSLGQFEEAYAELWAWLMDALQQLENTEPITGDPDAVGTQLSKHKASSPQSPSSTRCLFFSLFCLPLTSS